MAGVLAVGQSFEIVHIDAARARSHDVKQLGDILLEGGLVTYDQLAIAHAEQQRAGRALGRVLVDQGVLSESQLVAALAQQIGMRFVELTDHPVDPSAVALVPAAVCRQYTCCPIGFEDGRLLLAMADPANVLAIDDVRARCQTEVPPVVATRLTCSQPSTGTTAPTASSTT